MEAPGRFWKAKINKQSKNFTEFCFLFVNVLLHWFPTLLKCQDFVKKNNKQNHDEFTLLDFLPLL